MSLKHAILATLSYRPKNGYEIAKSIEGGIGFFWKATHQQIYKELSALEDSGFLTHKLVEQSDAPTKKVYKINKRGLEELSAWIGSETEDALIRDPFLIKIFAGHLIPAATLMEVLKLQQDRRKITLNKYRDLEKKYFAEESKLSLEDKFQYLVVKRGISHAKNWLEWSKEVENFLKSLL